MGAFAGIPGQNRRFAEKHPGAAKASGVAGTVDFFYIAYRESNAAALLELFSILSAIAGIGLMLAFYDSAEGLIGALIWAAGIFLVNRVFALAAWRVNYVQVRRRISSDIGYACEFAVKYPEQAFLCRELNEAFAANPDAVPAAEIREGLAKAAQNDRKILKIICIAGLSFLFLTLIAAIAFIAWVIRETT